MIQKFIKNRNSELQKSKLLIGASIFRASSLVGTNKEHFLMGRQWLENISSIVNFEGVPHSFSLLRGWERAYPETTGYILSTLTEGKYVFFERELSDFSQKIIQVKGY